jgi:hypothetical protein
MSQGSSPKHSLLRAHLFSSKSGRPERLVRYPHFTKIQAHAGRSNREHPAQRLLGEEPLKNKFVKTLKHFSKLAD